MPERAHVTSLEVLDSFRTALILYTDKARGVLDEVGAEIVRMKLWLETEQRSYWERQVRRRKRDLEQARQVLFNARLSQPHGASAPDFAAVRQATRALREAEEKRGRVKRWSREYERRVETLDSKLNTMRNILSQRMPMAAAYLAEAAGTLGAYAEMEPPPAPPAGQAEGSEEGMQ
jgi:hypothetical protein